jgi:hypothetical protein
MPILRPQQQKQQQQAAGKPDAILLNFQSPKILNQSIILNVVNFKVAQST